MLKPEERSLEYQWNAFKAMVIPTGASQMQLTEMKKGFYAGASSALQILTGVDDTVSDKEGIELIEGLIHECREFAFIGINEIDGK